MPDRIWWHPYGCSCAPCVGDDLPPTPRELAAEQRATAFGRDVRGGMAYGKALALHYPDDAREGVGRG